MDTPYQVNVNAQLDFEVTAADARALDVVAVGNGVFHILKNNKAYQAELLESNYAEKIFVFSINGNPLRVHVGDRYDQLITKMGLDKAKTQKLNEIKAPMPGLVLEISVSVGQNVEKGDKIAILEAMKMENVLKATGEGIVKNIVVEKGQAVEKGQVLIEFE
ncbi:MAG: hypothetical protein RL757_1595 [Bacteroidota bacterium]|jgi:biotin carboxyl carrier protein